MIIAHQTFRVHERWDHLELLDLAVITTEIFFKVYDLRSFQKVRDVKKLKWRGGGS